MSVKYRKRTSLWKITLQGVKCRGGGGWWWWGGGGGGGEDVSRKKVDKRNWVESYKNES